MKFEGLPHEKKESHLFQTQLRAALETIAPSTEESFCSGSKEEIIEVLENSMMKAAHGLPEELARRAKTVDALTLHTKAEEIIQRLSSEKDALKRAELQTGLIYQYIALISCVQGSGEKGFTPKLAREIGEMDCTLSAWSLKEKLIASGIKDFEFNFGYPPGHAVGIVKLSDSRTLYVDAQNGFIAEIDARRVQDKGNTNTAYPIYEITFSKRLSEEILQEGRVHMTRPDGSDHLPRYLGVRRDGTLHTLGNMHMLVNPESPVHATETAKRFRERLNNDPSEWKKFQTMVDIVAGGKVIQETKFWV